MRGFMGVDNLDSLIEQQRKLEREKAERLRQVADEYEIALQNIMYEALLSSAKPLLDRSEAYAPLIGSNIVLTSDEQAMFAQFKDISVGELKKQLADAEVKFSSLAAQHSSVMTNISYIEGLKSRGALPAAYTIKLRDFTKQKEAHDELEKKVNSLKSVLQDEKKLLVHKFAQEPIDVFVLLSTITYVFKNEPCDGTVIVVPTPNLVTRSKDAGLYLANMVKAIALQSVYEVKSVDDAVLQLSNSEFTNWVIVGKRTYARELQGVYTKHFEHHADMKRAYLKLKGTIVSDVKQFIPSKLREQIEEDVAEPEPVHDVPDEDLLSIDQIVVKYRSLQPDRKEDDIKEEVEELWRQGAYGKVYAVDRSGQKVHCVESINACLFLSVEDIVREFPKKYKLGSIPSLKNLMTQGYFGSVYTVTRDGEQARVVSKIEVSDKVEGD